MNVNVNIWCKLVLDANSTKIRKLVNTNTSPLGVLNDQQWYFIHFDLKS